MITIDREKCIGCGACVADCFPDALHLEDGKAVLGGACIECGHCFAVCPVKAIDMGEDYPVQDVIDFCDCPQTYDSEKLLAAIKSRRSIRRFTGEKIDKDTLAAVLEAGRFTPTGSNAQNVRYIVVQETLDAMKAAVWEGFDAIIDGYVAKQGTTGRLYNTLTRMRAQHDADANVDHLFFDAPALLIVVAPPGLNGGLAASSIALMAHAIGLGTLYSGFIQMALAKNPVLCEKIGVKPENIAACLLIGKPAVTYKRTAPRKTLQVDWR